MLNSHKFCACRKFSFIEGIITGGWSPADKNSDRVKDAAKFAVHNQYPNDNVDFSIIQALQQVVAGLKYDLTIRVTELSSKICSMHQYKVLHTLDQTYLLLDSQALTDTPCPSD